MENKVFIFTFCFGPKILGSNLFSFSIVYEFAQLISWMLNVFFLFDAEVYYRKFHKNSFNQLCLLGNNFILVEDEEKNRFNSYSLW